MNQLLLLSFLTAATAVHGKLAFYNQVETLSIDQVFPSVINLTPYFENRPLTFGLVANKTKDMYREGYMCKADSYDMFLKECKNKYKVKNAPWVKLIIIISRCCIDRRSQVQRIVDS